MAEYLIERYVSRADAAAVAADAARAQSAAEQLRREGTAVYFVRTIFLPEDETCFYLFHAEQAEDVREAARRAEIPANGVVQAISEFGDPGASGRPGAIATSERA